MIGHGGRLVDRAAAETLNRASARRQGAYLKRSGLRRGDIPARSAVSNPAPNKNIMSRSGLPGIPTRFGTFLIRILTLLVLVSSVHLTLSARSFREVELLSGAENLESFGMDTTDNWWAMTQPFSNQYRLIVNGDETETFERISPPIFSPNGLFWQTFAVHQNVLQFVSNVGDTWLDYTSAEPAVFSLDSRCIAFTAYDNDQAWAVRYRVVDHPEGGYTLRELERTQIYEKQSKLFVATDGSRTAYVGRRGDTEVVAIGDEEYAVYDKIEAHGFLADGSFLYSARLGDLWRLYRDDVAISSSFNSINYGVFNRDHSMFAFVAVGSVVSYAVLLEQDEDELQFSEQQESITALAIHPDLALTAFKAFNYGVPSVVYGSARYSATENTGALQFSHDGEELYYLECDVINCYMNVNGQRYDLSTDIDTGEPLVVAPGTSTFSFTTGLTQVVRSFDGKDVWSGMLVDQMGHARFNWRQNRYEALGIINDRLYMLYCGL